MRQVMKNIFTVYKELLSCSRRMRWQLPFYAICKVVSPLVVSAIPALAIALLTRDNFVDYVVGISAVLLFNVLIACANIVFEDRWRRRQRFISRTGCRVVGFAIKSSCLTKERLWSGEVTRSCLRRTDCTVKCGMRRHNITNRH